MPLTCCLFGEQGSQIGWCALYLVMARLRIVRSASSGGAGAKYEVPEVSNAFSWRATSRDLTLASTSSPLFTSTQRTEIGGLPVRSNALCRGTFTHTPLLVKNSNSFALASTTKSSRRTWPEMSSLKRPEYPCSGPQSCFMSDGSSATWTP